ncbi:hypothetical protein [Halorubrum sp. BV1]|uniref:hypothetical protein n=1 Tax=Halorubrum sp. BV1 TaxID=1498500 RepID=UPI000678EA73|nr:hypothetical protein [Halorubrum sp. BV1]
MILRVLLAVFGVVEFLFPRRLADASMSLATTDDSEYELRSWVYTVARVEGLCIAALALWYGRRASSGDDE